MRATRAVIHLDHLAANLRALQSVVGSTPITMAVKANAYGHGLVQVARAAVQSGVSRFGVATVQEGAELRESGIRAPVLLLGPLDPAEASRAVAAGLEVMCADSDGIRGLEAAALAAGAPAAVHLKVDTGMGRYGCAPEDALRLAVEVAASEGLLLAGVATHLAQADEVDRGFTETQLLRFAQCTRPIVTRFPGVALHAANSAGVLGYPGSHLDMVRPGIACYGYPPTVYAGVVELRPVMELRTRIAFLKRVAKGTPLSYGSTYRTLGSSIIATLPVGYGDGYPRALGGLASVLISGARFPVVGRVCMDQCLVDLGRSPDVQLGDEVVLFGPQAGAPTAAELAALVQAIPYEIVCGVSQRVPRIAS